MTSEEIHEAVRLIKQELRGMMNGVVSHSMREKGLAYKVNFGVELPRLQDYAAELRQRFAPMQNESEQGGSALYSLALRLWNEPIRECRLLAGMLMPPEAMDEQTAELWVEQMHFPEEAECTVLHLFQHLSPAADLAFRWIAREEPMFQFCGWLLMARLFMQGREPSQRDADELLDQAATVLRDFALQPAPQAFLQASVPSASSAQSSPSATVPGGISARPLPLAATVHKALLKYMGTSPTAEARGEELLSALNL